MTEKKEISSRVAPQIVMPPERATASEPEAIRATPERLNLPEEPMCDGNGECFRLAEVNADLLDALKGYVEWFGAAHEFDCPCDDTCACDQKPLNDAVNAAIAKAEGRS